ncbi:glycosyltransferase [bacterium]|nr:glycosyltransferase [bacterium]
MNIALVSGSAGDTHCGVGDYTYELAQHLALDAEVHLYFDHLHAPARPPFKRLTTLHLHPVKGFSVFSLNKLVRELRKRDYDIVHVQYPSKGYGTSVGPGFLPQNLAGMRSRSRIVVTLHEWITSHPLRKMVMDQMLPSTDALVVTNEAEMDALVNKLAGRRVVAIPVGNVLTSQAELAAIWLEAEGQPVPQPAAPAGPDGRIPLSLFHFGLPARGKGVDKLLTALKLVREAGVPAVLYLGGDFPPGEQRTETILNLITELNLSEAVVRLGHIPQGRISATAEQYCLAVFPFEEGYSSKRSSLAAISQLDLPVCVGGGSREEHPYYAPEQNTAESLAVLLQELLSGRLAREWSDQVNKQREYGRRFSFSRVAAAHLDLYNRLRKVDA